MVYGHFPQPKAQYYYLVFKVVQNGRTKLGVWWLPECTSEEQARAIGWKKLTKAAMWDVAVRPYKDTTKITQEYKAKWLDETGDLGNALQRATHKPPNNGGADSIAVPVQEEY